MACECVEVGDATSIYDTVSLKMILNSNNSSDYSTVQRRDRAVATDYRCNRSEATAQGQGLEHSMGHTTSTKHRDSD